MPYRNKAHAVGEIGKKRRPDLCGSLKGCGSPGNTRQAGPFPVMRLRFGRHFHAGAMPLMFRDCAAFALAGLRPLAVTGPCPDTCPLSGTPQRPPGTGRYGRLPCRPLSKPGSEKAGKAFSRFPALPLIERPCAVEVPLIRKPRAQEHERTKYKDELHIYDGGVQAERVGQAAHEHGPEEAEPLEERHVGSVGRRLIAGGDEFLRGDMDARNRNEEKDDAERDEGEALQHKPEAEAGRQEDEAGNAEPCAGFAAPTAETVGNDPGQRRDHYAGEQIYRAHVRPHFRAGPAHFADEEHGDPRHHAGIDHVGEADADAEHDERLILQGDAKGLSLIHI